MARGAVLRMRVLELDEQVINVPRHADAAAFAWIVPFDGDACKFVRYFLRISSKKMKRLISTYSTPKSSTMRLN